MSNHMMTLTGIAARLRGHNILITGTFPDDIEKSVTVQHDDIITLYGCNPAAFMEAYGDNEAVLCELFTSIAGIALSLFFNLLKFIFYGKH